MARTLKAARAARAAAPKKPMAAAQKRAMAAAIAGLETAFEEVRKTSLPDGGSRIAGEDLVNEAYRLLVKAYPSEGDFVERITALCGALSSVTGVLVHLYRSDRGELAEVTIEGEPVRFEKGWLYASEDIINALSHYILVTQTM